VRDGNCCSRQWRSPLCSWFPLQSEEASALLAVTAQPRRRVSSPIQQAASPGGASLTAGTPCRRIANQ
jgi:hypothetical protein